MDAPEDHGRAIIKLVAFVVASSTPTVVFERTTHL